MHLRAKGPNVCRSTPSDLELGFRGSPDRCANDITILREDRISTNRISAVGQLNVSETHIALSISY